MLNNFLARISLVSTMAIYFGLNSVSAAEATPSFLQSDQGLVAIEAEHFHTDNAQGKNDWAVDKKGGYSGEGAMRASSEDKLSPTGSGPKESLAGEGPPPPVDQGENSQGLIVIEAEHYHAKVAKRKHHWMPSTEGDYSGEGAMMAAPEDKVSIKSKYKKNSPRMNYRVKFTKPGTYYVWLRALGPKGSSNSVHLGFNGKPIKAGKNIEVPVTGDYVWTEGMKNPINITKPGLHTLNLWMRESGAIIDKIVLSDQPGFTPTGKVPSLQVSSQQAGGRPGNIDGVRLWTLPDTSNVNPEQCWHSVGSSPDGDIYIGGMDHVTNSGLYRLFVQEDTLRPVGDARSASQAVGNWQSGETAEKFHTRPTWHNGRVYVATTDKTDVGGDYLGTRGFHWYAYDIASEAFSDLSASEPGGVGAPHLQILTIASDPINNVLYGMANASGEIVRYDVATGLTQNLGKPASFDRYIYANRFMWVDSRGILYFTAGSVKPNWHQGESAEVFGHVYTYDPSTGFGERQDFPLVVAQSIEVGQWTRDREHLYAMDDRGALYRFDDNGPTWTFLSNIFPLPNRASAWSLQLSPDEQKIYMIFGRGERQLVEYDIPSNTTRTLVSNISQLSTELGNQGVVTGYDAWDNDGNFYFAAFNGEEGNVILTRVDPVRLKADLGILP